MVGNGNDTQEDPMPTTDQASMKLETKIEPFYIALFRAALAVHGAQRLDFTISHVEQLDNQGLHCLHCSSVNSMITMQAYYRETGTGDDVMVDGDPTCIVRLVARDADRDVPVRIEVAR